MCPNTLVASISAAAITLAEGRTTDEISLLGAIFTQLGDTLATIAVQRGIIEAKCDQSPNTSNGNQDKLPS